MVSEVLYEFRKSDQKKSAVAAGFGFIRQDAFDSLETVPWLEKDCKEFPQREKLDRVEGTQDQIQISYSAQRK